MDIVLNGVAHKQNSKEMTISGSKSESNRLLILQNLFPEISIPEIDGLSTTLIINVLPSLAI